MEPVFQDESIESEANYLTDFNEFSLNSLDHSEEAQEVQESQDEYSEFCHRPTFKNTLQAKKRLQAFSSQKQAAVSPSYTKKKLKTILVTEKSYNEKGEIQETIVNLKRPPKKGENPLDKAKAVIQEIELLKKLELLKATPVLFKKLPVETLEDKINSRKSRSRSKSSERGFVFRKREKKIRNYRRNDSGRRSPSPQVTTAKDKPSDKSSSRYRYPKNWEEFFRDKWTFEKLSSKSSNSAGKSNSLPNDISRHLLFEGPADLIKPFYFKNEKGEEILVPYHLLKYTAAKPKISYSVNLEHIKEQFLTRDQLLSRTNKNFKQILEKFFSRNTRTKFRTSEPIGQRNWYQKNWKDSDSKILETSIGLSFLQTYSDDDDEEEEQLMLEPLSPTKIEESDVFDKKESYQTDHYETIKSNNLNTEMEGTPTLKNEDVLPHEFQENDQKTTFSDNTPEYSMEDRNEEYMAREKTLTDEIGPKIENEGSWTPERILPFSNDMWDETPKAKKDGTLSEERKTKKKDADFEELEAKQKAREIYSEDEWDETPEKKTVPKKEKRKKFKKSVSKSPSPIVDKKKTKKKRKLDKKKKLKEKEKRTRKKEKLKAEKLRLKKEKRKKLQEKERKQEKEILKKLKKEIEQNLEEVDREEWEAKEKKMEEEVIVKVEKEDDYEKIVRPPEDLRNFLDKKVGKVSDLREKVEKKKKNKRTNLEVKKIEVKPKKRKNSKKSILREIKIETLSEDDTKVSVTKHNLSFKMGEELIKGDISYKVVEDLDQISHKTVDNSIRDDFSYEVVNVDNLCVEESFPLEKEFIQNLDNFENSMEDVNIEIKHSTPEITKESIDQNSKKKLKRREEVKQNDKASATTPDTDEYHSNWESDEGVSPIVKMASKKPDRNWESDEEVFDRSYSSGYGKNSDRESPVLEMPLHIKSFSRRGFDTREHRIDSKSRTRSPEYLDVDNEIKLLEAERINLSKERMRLEMERIRIHELERKKSMEEIEYMCGEVASPTWKVQDKRRNRWDLREDRVDSSTSKVRKENAEEIRYKGNEMINETANLSHPIAKSESSRYPTAVFNVSSSPEITSTKSPTPTVLESAYQEFMRCVSVGEDSKDFTVISSTESEMLLDIKEDNSAKGQRKNRLTRSERDKNRAKQLNAETASATESDIAPVVGTTDPKVLQEILLPGEVVIPEIPMPVPVPSPKLEVLKDLPAGTLPIAVFNVTPIVKDFNIQSSLPFELIESPEQPMEPTQESNELPPNQTNDSPSKKPFSFSTLVLPTKRSAMLDKSSWKLDEDSDEDHMPTKKKYDEIKLEHEYSDQKLKKQLATNSKYAEEEPKKEKESNRKMEEVVPQTKEQVVGKDVKEKERKEEIRKKDEKSSKRKHSRSRSPVNTTKEKRRREGDNKKKDDGGRRRESDSRRREDETKRKEEETKRRERGKRSSPPARHREPSPRRSRMSSPSHRRSSPKHRSPLRRLDSSRRPERSDRRHSPARRRRSHSPAKSTSRRRSPGPREPSPGRHFHHTTRPKSPGPRSPMDGLKRSVAADSTISDDLLPQPYMGESSNSPLSSTIPTSSGRKSRIHLSPKRPSLDERINQVLGLEIEPPPSHTPEVWKPTDGHMYQQNIVYGEYQHYHDSHRQQEHYRQHISTAVPPPFPRQMTSLPHTASKVLQVGNILQVVPTEEICVPPTPVQPPQSQKMIQVGNIVQIVPTDIDVILPALPPPPPPEESPPPLQEEREMDAATLEKLSAEAMLAAKNAERRAERVMKRKQKEERKKEKERRKKERDKKKKLKLKISTEEMIKRALEMDGLISNETEDLNASVPEIISDTPGLDPSKSILSTSITRCTENVSKTEGRKSVQFADGIRPGEGTSPSGGEELSSPPPQTEILPKVKKYKKIGVAKKKKRKIKVKVIKRRQTTPDSDEEYENLPPPSPPPGSPPPHIFPARVKVHTINNIPQHYLPSFGVTTSPQTPTINQGLNVVYQTPPTPVYRSAPALPPPTHMNVVGQHYPRQPMSTHMPPLPPQHMQMSISHRDHQSYSSY